MSTLTCQEHRQKANQFLTIISTRERRLSRNVSIVSGVCHRVEREAVAVLRSGIREPITS